MGFEVRDVTAELYRQGTLTAFQVPQSTAEPQTFYVVNAQPPPAEDDKLVTKGKAAPMAPVASPTPIDGLPLKKFPSKMSEIMTLAGTRQWEAREGAYVVLPFNGRDNFNGQPTYDVPLVYVDTESAGERTNLVNTAPFNIGSWTDPISDTQPVVFDANKFVPFDSKGILLSGLNAESTFTINVIYYLESFPGPDNPQLISLALPSCPRDEAALELISVATQDLPIAVPVSENGLGDWFAEVVAEAAPWVGTIGGAIPGVGPAISAAAAASKLAADSYIGSSLYTGKKNRQMQPPAPQPHSSMERVMDRIAIEDAFAAV